MLAHRTGDGKCPCLLAWRSSNQDIYCSPPGFTVVSPGKYLAGGLQSGRTANLTGAQYILQPARIYSGVSGKVPGWRSAVGSHCKFNRRAVYTAARQDLQWCLRESTWLAVCSRVALQMYKSQNAVLYMHTQRLRRTMDFPPAHHDFCGIPPGCSGRSV